MFQPSVRKQHNAGYKHKVFDFPFKYVTLAICLGFNCDLLLLLLLLLFMSMVFRRTCGRTINSLRSNKLRV